MYMSLGDPPPADPLLALAFEHWRQGADGLLPPSRQAIDPPLALPPALLPTMILFDIEAGEGDDLHYRYRLMGTELARRTRRDLTGLRITDCFPRTAIAADLEIYRQVAAQRLAYTDRRRSMVAEREDFEVYRRLILPLMDAAGRRVSMLWICLRFE